MLTIIVLLFFLGGSSPSNAQRAFMAVLKGPCSAEDQTQTSYMCSAISPQPLLCPHRLAHYKC